MKKYPWQLLVQLGSHIQHDLYQSAHATLDEVLAIIASPRSRLPVRKLRCAQVASFCLRGAYQGGAPSSVILDEHLELLERLALQRHWKSVVRVMHLCVDAMIKRVQPELHTNIERLISQIRENLEQSLDSPRDLAQYAREAGVSVGHLSRCFTANVGCSFREQQRTARIQVAKRMLYETSLKIGTISHRVGLRHPSQFIAQFRRETGMTPATFRKMHS